jgi:hypothetical protein
MGNLQSIPGIGKAIEKDLHSLGIHEIADLQNKDPEQLYKKLCDIQGKVIDRCMLYTFRCAVYYASHAKHDKELLKWWNWKEKISYMPCVKCPFCKEVVEAKIVEMAGTKTISCPACKVSVPYK